jgi:hypothetical protein
MEKSMTSLDLNKCAAPLEVIKVLRAAAVQYMSKANRAEDYEMKLADNPWRIIARELDHSVNTIEHKLSSSW